MISHLKTEWLKIKNYNAFIIITVFFVLGIFASNYIVFKVFKSIVQSTEASILLNKFNPYDFQHVWQTISYVTGYLLILPALLIIILITNEYNFKTNRQNIIDGWERATFIDVKIVLAIIIAALSTVLAFLTGIFFGFKTGTEFNMENFSGIGFLFIKAVSYNLFAVMVSVLIKRTGFAIGLYFIYLGAENVIQQILDALSLKLKVNNNIDLGALGSYLPMNASDGLLTFPENPLKPFAKALIPTDYLWVEWSFAIFYLILFFVISRKVYLKKDI
jgi:hypothetical protein